MAFRVLSIVRRALAATERPEEHVDEFDPLLEELYAIDYTSLDFSRVPWREGIGIAVDETRKLLGAAIVL